MNPKDAPIKVLANTVDVIEVLAAEGPLSPAEIAERISLPRSSVYRLVDALTAISLAETLPDARVRLSTRWLLLADSARAGMTEWAGAGDVLDRLVERTGQTAFLSVPHEDRAVCVDWRPGRGIDVLALKPGRSLPLHAGAAGRVLLAYQEDAEDYLRSAPFERLTAHTLIRARELAKDIARTREQGYVVSEEDVTVGISALGVPIRDVTGRVAGCVSLGGLAGDFRAMHDELIAVLQELTSGFVCGAAR